MILLFVGLLAPCPAGFECAPVMDIALEASTQCVPLDGGICPCSERAVADGATTHCTWENQHGTCWGQRACGPGGLSDCDAPEPAAEVCDGVDDDCDGETDEADALGCTVYVADVDQDGRGDSDDWVCTCDLTMPDMDGVDVLRRIRSRWPALPVLLVSGYSRTSVADAIADAGVCFLQKPFTLATLSQAVSETLG